MHRLPRGSAGVLAAVLLSGLTTAAAGLDQTADDARRARMVRVVEQHARDVAPDLGGRLIGPAILDVMGRVPRHLFVPEPLRAAAYDDRPLAIGHGQTISQPFIVALMTELLEPRAGHVVLEVGTGSGYQAAILSHLVARVCSVEIIPDLGQSAAGRLRSLGYANVRTRVSDGYYGWPACGPFDGIVVTAAAGQVPPPLIEQLKPGGRMVIPVGGPFFTQQLVLVEKAAGGQVTTRQLLPVRFVPLTRGRS